MADQAKQAKTPASITETYNGILDAVEKATIPAFVEEQPKARVTIKCHTGRLHKQFML